MSVVARHAERSGFQVECLRELPLDAELVTAVAFGAVDGRAVVAAGGEDGTIEIELVTWNAVVKKYELTPFGCQCLAARRGTTDLHFTQ